MSKDIHKALQEHLSVHRTRDVSWHTLLAYQHARRDLVRQWLLVPLLAFALALSGCFLSNDDEGNPTVLTYDFLRGVWVVQNFQEFLSCSGGTDLSLTDYRILFSRSENGFEGAFLFGHHDVSHQYRLDANHSFILRNQIGMGGEIEGITVPDFESQHVSPLSTRTEVLNHFLGNVP